MRKWGRIGVALLLLGGVSGCGSTGLDGLFKEILSLIREATSLLQGVKNEASARAVMSRLEKIGNRADELNKKAQALKLSDAETQKVMEKYRDELLAAADRLIVAADAAQERAPRYADRIRAVVARLIHSKAR